MENILNIAGVIALALAPVAFILIYVITKDKYDREPLPYLIAAFSLGALGAYPVVKSSAFLSELLNISENQSPLHLLLYTFIIIALVEELMKYLTLTLFFYPLKKFNEPLDGIIYCVSIAMGFAAVENIIYVYQSGFATGILRMFTAVPSHAVFGTIIGYYVGKAKFTEGTKPKLLLHLQGFLIALFLHTFYDYFIFLDWGISGLISIAILIKGILFARSAIQFRQESSPFRPAPTEVVIEEEIVSSEEEFSDFE